MWDLSIRVKTSLRAWWLRHCVWGHGGWDTVSGGMCQPAPGAGIHHPTDPTRTVGGGGTSTIFRCCFSPFPWLGTLPLWLQAIVHKAIKAPTMATSKVHRGFKQLYTWPGTLLLWLCNNKSSVVGNLCIPADTSLLPKRGVHWAFGH